MTKALTQSLKKKDLPILINRDDGFQCFYCKSILKSNYVFDHLNGNRWDNRIENLVLACQSCNIKKISDMEFQLMADEKLGQNEEMGLHYLEDWTAHENNSSEIEINKTLYNFTKQYITEQIALEGKYSFDDAISELPFLCQERFGHGSEATIRRYLKQLTCKASEWQVIRDDKNKKIICKRGVLN